eukprot:TRINITY_DN3199_c0_g1_i1.p1 TRINITY_DN3199_c0_g1~~TRINITY_DN3199_c0_g1_i1.p1  ORF type:complete len:437 (+),score=49.07 TRINITY_DN3199_c0_g1_i1:68-1312(+)
MVDKYDPHNHMASAAEQWDGWSSSEDGNDVAQNKEKSNGNNKEYNLSLGWPRDDEAPRKIMKQACCDVLDDNTQNPLNYAENMGDELVLTRLGEFLTRRYGFPVTSENLLITGGSSQGLDLCCTALTKKNRKTVLVEEVTYFLAVDILKTHNVNVVPLKTDHHGTLPSEIDDLSEDHDIAFFYMIPTHHNPTGYSMPDSRRMEIINACRRKNIKLVADEVYHCLEWGRNGVGVTPMACLKGSCGVVISISSFTKILAPGLRVGWVQAGKEIIEMLEKTSGLIQSGGGLSQFTAHLVAKTIKSHELDKYLQNIITSYSLRAAALTDAAVKYLQPLGVTFSKPTGGYFMWVTLPPTVTSIQLISALPDNVKVADGAPFRPSKAVCNNVRLCFVRHTEAELAEAVEIIADVLKMLVI